LYNNIGWDYHDQGEYRKALEIHRKGLEWHEARDRKSGAEIPGRSTLIARWSVAKQLRLLGRVEEALAIQYELLELYRKAEVGDGFVQEEIGECLLLQGREEEARPHFAEAWRLLKEISWVADDDPERLERIRDLARD
jgi:tetratricopeptide (TPR) repeat protein